MTLRIGEPPRIHTLAYEQERNRLLEQQDRLNLKRDRNERLPNDVYLAGRFLDRGGEVINLKHPEFGAAGDGSTDDTAAVQAALDAAADYSVGSRDKAITTVFAPFGHYRISQIEIPLGVSLIGVGAGTAGDAAGALFQQIAGTNDDMIRFAHNANNYANQTRIENVGLLGNNAAGFPSGSDTTGHAIAFYNVDDETTDPAQLVRIRNVEIRNFPGSGIYVPRRGFPFRLEWLFIWDCDRYGIEYEANSVSGLVHFDKIDVDDNKLGGIYIDNENGSSRDAFLITSIKVEKSLDTRQENGIIVHNGNSCTVHLQGVVHYKGSGASSDPNSVVQLTGSTTPSVVSWDGCESRNTSTVMIADDVNSVTVPGGRANGIYRPSTLGGLTSFGGSPSFWLYETDAASNEKITELMKTGGDFRIRALDDNGANPVNLLIADRNGTAWPSIRWFTDHRFEKRVRYTQGTFASGDATPSVGTYSFYKTANASPTTITRLDGGATGQMVVVEIADANTTIGFLTGTNLKGNGGADWSPTTGDHMTCIYNGTNWFCTVSDNTA
jgi:hypothetical protein